MSQDYKKLFNEKDAILTNQDRETLGQEVESVGYMTEYFNKKQRFIPPVDFSQFNKFARFGSAEKYYIDAVDRIYKTYPYDGSLKERIQWELSSSYLDLHVFENEYPRTNGYVNFIGAPGTTDNSGGFYPPAGTDEYILVKWGLNTSQRSQGKDIQDTTGDYKSGYANIWDTTKDRESNLLIDGTPGNTVEFWLKKEAYVSDQDYFEVIFDAHVTGTVRDDADYGRLTVMLATTGTYGNSSNQPFLVRYGSGSSNTSFYLGSSTLTTASIADGNWHHYAIRFATSGSDTVSDLYVDGTCNDTDVYSGRTIDYVSGNIVATVGALASSFNIGGIESGSRGWAKLSGSLDELRFWKTKRTSQQIGRQYIEPVGGGTNTDDANTDLGIYYKFNEGITLTSSVDKTILDYSGRISNGNFVGYNTSSRSTNSAMVESGKVDREFKDPILYYFHPDVAAYRSKKLEEGRIYDYSNNAAVYHTLPSWILEEDEAKEYSPLRNLTQIVGSYFDSLANQIWALPKLKHKNYLSSSFKSYPFSDRLLESVGFSYFPELFSDATSLAQFRNRDDKTLFKQKLYDVKNRIYQNIYNNIIYIYKTKGTEKSFRNLIRCFGFDDEIYKINTYGNRVTYQLKDSYSSVAEFKKYANFAVTETQEATVFPVSSSENSNSTSFISGSGDKCDYMAFTMESEAAFPRRASLADANTTVTSDDRTRSKSFRSYVPFKIASLFGVHQVNGTTENDLTWATNDYANFQVYAIRDENHSKRCYFKLTGVGSTVIPTLTSSYFDEVFDDTRWTFSVSVRPKIYPIADLPDGSSGSAENKGHTVEFYGVEKVLDTIKNEFLLTSSIAHTSGTAFINNSKSIYIGAHRENFSGTLQQKSDAGISSTRVWLSYLPTGTIQQHAQDAKNYGLPNPYRSTFLYQTSITGTRVPEIHTLALNWIFDTLTGSDSSGEFIGQDFSSGSVSLQNRYGWFGDIVGKQYLPKGYNFPIDSSTVVNRKYVYSAKKQLPEYINSSDMVNILTDDDISFNKGDLLRPTNYYMYIEKSMYQTISEEMIKMFSSIKDFNNLAGEPVNKYRGKYKHMEKLRQLFFERVGNTPDLDKYIDFYKWVDKTLDVLLGYLVPLSADISDQYGSNIRTLVESHVLERNKYKWQFPTLEDKGSDPEGNILGINELLYDWEFGHNPTNDVQSDNCLWWEERAERTDALASGDTNVDSDKQTILDSTNNETNAKNYMLYDSATSTTYSGSTFVIRRLGKPYKFKVDESRTTKGGTNYYPNKKVDIVRTETNLETSTNFLAAAAANVESFKDCNDKLDLLTKRKYDFNALLRSELTTATEKNYFNAKGALFAPFSMYSSSISGGYYDAISNNFKTAVDITNLHEDTYGTLYGVPMQGPFTDKYVGGLQYRHIALTVDPTQTGSDNRPEGWSLSFNNNILTMSGPAVGVEGSRPKATRLRDETAKRPVNIRNIQQATGSSIIGNYNKDYEILMTGGRLINNRYFVKNEGITASSITSLAISGVLDYDLPGASQSDIERTQVIKNGLTSSVKNSYIIVNRFSAPGDPATMGRGFLNIESQEYSVYNALPWRNVIIRNAFQELFTDHTKQFGYFSDAQNSASYALAGVPYPGTSGSVNALDYAGSASFHKINRNSRRTPRYADATTTSSYVEDAVYDNWFVQHQIPQTDLQYAWITASVIEGYTGSALYGFEQPDFSNASLASTDITFCSASDFGSYLDGSTRIWGNTFAISGASGFVPTDFAGINSNIYESASILLNTLGELDQFNSLNKSPTPGFLQSYYTADFPVSFNSLILHRQGPYGWPSWKQTRGANHPIIRAHRKENIQSFLKETTLTLPGQSSKPIDSLISQIEPPVTSKYKPFKHYLKAKTAEDGTTEIAILHTYGNEKCMFPQKVAGSLDLNKTNFINTLAGPLNKNQQTLIYDSLNDFIINNNLSGAANPVDEFISLSMRETVYPREHYTYIKSTRQRDNFQNQFWRDARADRTRFNAHGNSQGVGFILPYDGTGSAFPARWESMWPLDARSNIDTGPLPTDQFGFTGQWPNFGINTRENDCGELQNSYTVFPTLDPPGCGLIRQGPGATYNRAVPEIFPGALYTSSCGAPGEIHAGETKWEAGAQAGINPFYDTYDYYIEELKRIGKDYGIVPEFRISEHMDFYVNGQRGENFLKQNDGMFTLTGSTLSSSNDSSFYTVYTTTDFMKHFSIVRDDYRETAIPTELKLECKALMKFLPYDGFYPAQRTLQMATLFSQSFAPNATYNGAGSIPGMRPYIWREMLKPMFSPGIIYNSIKSGIAVDYPIATASWDWQDKLQVTGTNTLIYPALPGFRTYDGGDPRMSGTFDIRLPFETLADPDFYLNGITVPGQEPYHDSGLSNQGYNRLKSGSFGIGANPLFHYAMNNFLAETPSFFLEGGGLSTISSKSDASLRTVEENKQYKMRIVLGHSKWDKLSLLQNTETEYAQNRSFDMASYYYNPPTITMYNRAFDRSTKQDYSSSFVGVSGTIQAYGSSFGPPCDASSSYGKEASFEPYTPPYYNGYSHIEVTYDSGIGGDLKISDILAACRTSATYYRENTRLGYQNYTAGLNAMQLSASLNWDQLVTTKDSTGNWVGSWVIQPKWECPVLDFNSADITLPISGSGSVAKGMWHQYGSIPAAGNGIYLSVQDVPDSGAATAPADSLKDLLGITDTKVKLGQISKEGKRIYEAIIAVPFRMGATNAKDYFNIPRETIDWAIADMTAADDPAVLNSFLATKPWKGHKPSQSVINMIKKMKKFVIPPTFDFLTNDSVDPLAMVIFEFSMKLEQQDLVNIWQNLPPQSPSTIITGSQATISLDLLGHYEDIKSDEPLAKSWKGFSLLNEVPAEAGKGVPGPDHNPFPDNIQWIVFKVKQKAQTDYFDITAKNDRKEMAKEAYYKALAGGATVKGALRAANRVHKKTKSRIPDYSFNWPYDFCSLVELAKIDSEYKLEHHPSLELGIKKPVFNFNNILNAISTQTIFTPPITHSQRQLILGRSGIVGTNIARIAASVGQRTSANLTAIRAMNSFNSVGVITTPIRFRTLGGLT